MNTKEGNNYATGLEIAVIGMVGRFPGAKNIAEFWDNLKNGVEAISFFTDEELMETGIEADLVKNPDYVKAKGVLEDSDCFDSLFFDYSPREAELMDPQFRILHECAWHTLEDAGYDPDSYTGAIGLYVGSLSNYQWVSGLLSRVNHHSEQIGIGSLNDRDFLSTRIAYKLNLKGPAVNVQTACSTSLVAIYLACQGLLSGESDMALAGGVSVWLPAKSGYLYEKGMVRSPDGRCRAFDAEAAGTNGGDAVALVLLKRLEDARADGDNIYAVVKGSAVNNDGKRKVGYTAPSVQAQAEVIHAALQMAEVEPESITYVEAHGTGTPLGDPVEVEALKRAFEIDQRQTCAIGSLKTNMGHLDAVAGVAGFIKTVLALKHRLIPPSLHYKKPNPAIDFENSPFYVNTQPREWKRNGYPLRAGVSSFGIGGTNAHTVLEEAPEAQLPAESRNWKLLLLSARTPSALERTSEHWLAFLKNNPGVNLADAAYTLQVGRKAFEHRRMVVCSDVENAIEALSPSTEAGKQRTFFTKEEKKSIVFMFPGLGSQYVNMGLDLYQTEPVFRENMDRCFEILEPLIGYNIKDVLYPLDPGDNEENQDLARTDIAQLLIFIFEYSLAMLLMKWGIKPDAMIGYSFGEFVAACLAGVFSLEDALRALTIRGELIRELPNGRMLSVPLSAEELLPLLPGDELVIGIDNGSSCVASGTNEAVSAFEKQAKEKKLICMPMDSTHAVHSTMMEPILNRLTEQLRTISLHPPQIPYISTVTGEWMTVEDATSPEYWAKQLRETVYFAKGIRKLLEQPDTLFLEVGAGRDISALVKREIEIEESSDFLCEVVNLVPHRGKTTGKQLSDSYYLINKIGLLWCYGVPIHWQGFYSQEKRNRVSLPTYSFEKQRFQQVPDVRPQEPGKSRELSDWFYIPSWKRQNFLGVHDKNDKNDLCWLVFSDALGIGDRVVDGLKKGDPPHQKVITVKRGPVYKKQNAFEYILNPADYDDYKMLLEDLGSAGVIPDGIIHLWGMTAEENQGRGNEIAFIEENVNLGFYSLLYLARALGRDHRFTGKIEINVVTDFMQAVTGEEELHPGKAAVLGPCRVIPQEYPNLTCRSIDVIHPADQGVIDLLLREITGNAEDKETVVAFRGNHRWIQTFDPVRLQEGETAPVLRQGGVYLVIGGLGDIGCTLAEYLIKSVGAKVILTGRTQLPPPERWSQELIMLDEEDKVSQGIKKLQQLQEPGGEVFYYGADLSDSSRMQEAIEEGEQRFGPINGVIHSAGTVSTESFRTIEEIDGSQCRLHFEAKLYGLVVLEELLKDKNLDFCLMISSISTVLGGLGFVAYSAANHFMDAFSARYNQKKQEPWLVVDWDGTNKEDTEKAFHSILSYDPIEQVIFSVDGDLEGRIARWVKLEDVHPDDKEKKGHARPELPNVYVAPGNALEQKLADIWQRFFGIEKIGVTDDLYDLGGDSLKSINIISIIHKELNVTIPIKEFFDNSTIEGVAGYLAGVEKETYIPIEPSEKKEYYVLSSAQKRLYFLQQMVTGSIAYNSPEAITLEGAEPDINKLKDTFIKLIRRHESLRTSIRMKGEEPVQKVHDEVEFEIEYHDITGTRVDVKEIINNHFVRPFDLSQAPLFRVGLIKEHEDKHILMIDIHHIITDGVSREVFINEFMEQYANEDRELPPLTIQYKDYAQWQNSEERKEMLKEQGEYWIGEFEGEIPVLNLPIDYPRPEIQSFEGDVCHFDLSKEEAAALKDLAAEEEVTLFMVLLSIYYVLLSKLSGQEDIIVATPTAGRGHADLQEVMGVFINTLALRDYPSAHKTFQAFLREVKTRTLKAFDNQDYQFEDLIDQMTVNVNRDLSRNPLFDVVFIMQSLELMPQRELPGLTVKTHPYQVTTSKFDLRLDCNEQGDGEGLVLWFEYSTRLFKEETIERFVTYFKNTVSEVIKNPFKKIGDIDIIPGEEKERLLHQFNHTRAPYPGDKTLHQLFEEQAGRVGGKMAVIGKGGLTPIGSVTYKQLNQMANHLAHLLRAKGVESDSIVGLMMPRSVEAVIAIIGILKAGAAYLPLDPGYPEERIRFMLRDSGAGVLLSGVSGVSELSKDIEVIDLHEIIGPMRPIGPITHPLPTHPHQLAYVIYTSGSTGKPKGVMVEHRNVVNYIWWAIKNYVKNEVVHFPLFTSLSFDLTVTSIFTPLLSGNAIVVYEGEGKEPLIEKVVEENRVGVVKCTPSHLKLILESANGSLQSNIKRFILGGEALETSTAQKIVETFNKDVVLYNEYGPTETAVGCMIYPFKPETDTRHAVPVGIPADNVQVYILDKHKKPLPLGAAGEMYVSGDGAARGYLNRPALTAQRFVENPFLPGKRMYKTGDLARFLSDGNIEFLGRIDQQVKIRGFRIELGEIENKLMAYRSNTPDTGAGEALKEIEPADIQGCQRCLLPVNYPDIQLNDEGICSVCREYDRYKDEVDRYFKTGADFERLIEETRQTKQGTYDCLLLFSGGKDSTYVLYQLIDMGLKVLTFTFDNGYISDAAFANIKRTTTALGVENIVCTAENMNQVFVESLNTNHDVCHGCWNALNNFGIKVAHEHGISLVISGLSRGQIFEMRLEELFRQGIFDEKEVEQNLLLFRKSFHSRSNKFARLLDLELAEDAVEQIHFIDFFRYFAAPVSEIREYLTRKGWVQPEDTGFCSSNCIINEVGIYVHLKEEGYHFYAPQLSWDCRLGCIPREVGLKEIAFESDGKLPLVDGILKEIGYYDPPIKDAVVVVNQDESGDKYLCAYIVPGSAVELNASELRGFLSEKLPDYMVPSRFVSLEKIPLTPNGKLDRKALDSLGERMETGAEYVAPGSKMEKVIADIWKEVLKIDKVSIHDNFFDIGGHSFDIVKVNGKLRKAFERDISVAEMFRFPTINSLAEYFRQDETRGLPSDEEIDESVSIMEEAAHVLFRDEIE